MEHTGHHTEEASCNPFIPLEYKTTDTVVRLKEVLLFWQFKRCSVFGRHYNFPIHWQFNICFSKDHCPWAKNHAPSHFANPLSLMHAGEAQCSLGQLAGRSYISTHYIPSPSKITIKQQLHLHLCLSELQTWAVAGDIRRLNLISGLAISRISALSGLDFRFTLWRDSMEASFSTGTSVARQRRARKRHRISTCKNRCQKIQLNMILAVHFVKLVKTWLKIKIVCEKTHCRCRRISKTI